MRSDSPYAAAGASQMRSASPFAQVMDQHGTDYGAADYDTSNGGEHDRLQLKDAPERNSDTHRDKRSCPHSQIKCDRRKINVWPPWMAKV